MLREEFEILANKSAFIDDAWKRLQELGQGEETQIAYDYYEKKLRDYYQQIEDARAEGRKEIQEDSIKKLIASLRKYSIAKKDIVIELCEQYGLTQAKAVDKVEQYWE